MASGSEHYAAAEQALLVAINDNSAMALRAADVHAQLAVAAAYVAVAVQNKGVTQLTADMQAFATAIAKGATPIPLIKAVADGLGIKPA